MHSKFGLFQMSSLSLCAALSKVNFVVYYNTLKPADKTAQVTGIYKDDDDKYSLENLLKAQEGGDLQ